MSIVETFNASTSWTCPEGVTSVTVECYGPGGNGGPGEGSIEGYAGGGGGGGAYASALVAVTPGAIYTLSVPAGGSAQPTYFKDAFTVKADYGRTGSFGTVDYGGPGGPGGSIADCAGSTRLAGQDGATGTWNDGGAGGNAGGPAGGVGGTGNGGTGAAPGGGGGGGHWNNVPGPGSGGAGRIILTYDNSVTRYTAQLQSFSRTPVTMLVLTMDYCGRTCGVSPCLATGEKCYNTFPTCRYKTAYLKQQKEYKFTSTDAPLPFKSGERPYLKEVKYLPTEIKENLTISSRVTAEFLDEPDGDIGIDPYVSERTSVQGTFWKKFLARNPNYQGRPIKIYEGFVGLPESDFQQRFVGIIDNITLSKGNVKIEVADLLKKLSNVEVPAKLNIKLVSEATVDDTSVTLNSAEGLDSPAGYIRIGDEIIHYTGINASASQLTGCSRGYFSTTASSHAANDKVQPVRYYVAANPFEILMTMLQADAQVDAENIDLASFTDQRDWPGGELNFSAIISEPTKLDKLYFEIIDLIDCKSWVAEDLKITIKRNLPNEPGRVFSAVTDEANIIHNSGSVDLNQKSRISRISLYWDKTALGKPDDVNSYKRLDIALDTDAESANEYNEISEKKIFTRWISSGFIQEELLDIFVKNFTTRQLFRYRNAQPIITLDVELKDSVLKTGSFLRMSTDELQNTDGSVLTNEIFQIVKRELKGKKVTLRALKTPLERFCFIAPDTTEAYDSASDDDREYGFITDNDGLINSKPGYYIY